MKGSNKDSNNFYALDNFTIETPSQNLAKYTMASLTKATKISNGKLKIITEPEMVNDTQYIGKSEFKTKRYLFGIKHDYQLIPEKLFINNPLRYIDFFENSSNFDYSFNAQYIFHKSKLLFTTNNLLDSKQFEINQLTPNYLSKQYHQIFEPFVQIGFEQVLIKNNSKCFSFFIVTLQSYF